ncbi:MAG: hypothetical protein J6S61_00425 [Elusimicrobiaceae bacterium]|nr:hypothetical protein [Elusimicrobiaceae bacterium]
MKTNANGNRVNLTQKVSYPWTFKALKALCGFDMELVAITLYNYLLELLANDESGKEGKAFELTIRSLLAGRLMTTLVINGLWDLTSKMIQRYYNLPKLPKVEVKHACCQLPKPVDYVVYTPVLYSDESLLSQSYVFTWEEWQAMLNGYEGRGQLTKFNASRNCYNIQSFYGSETIRPKASKPIANYLWSCCLEKITLAEMKESFEE